MKNPQRTRRFAFSSPSRILGNEGLLQRMLLAECREAPASLLCAVDGLLLMLPAGVLTTLDERFFLEAWNVWLRNPSIMLMLALSVFLCPPWDFV